MSIPTTLVLTWVGWGVRARVGDQGWSGGKARLRVRARVGGGVRVRARLSA